MGKLSVNEPLKGKMGKFEFVKAAKYAVLTVSFAVLLASCAPQDSNSTAPGQNRPSDSSQQTTEQNRP